MCFEKTQERVMTDENDDAVNEAGADLDSSLPWRSAGHAIDSEVRH